MLLLPHSTCFSIVVKPTVSWVSFVLCTLPFRPQTKGVKSIVSIKPENAAWYAAIGGGGAALLGSAIAWPIMRKVVKRYDEQHTIPKDGDGKTTHKHTDVQEDR